MVKQKVNFDYQPMIVECASFSSYESLADAFEGAARWLRKNPTLAKIVAGIKYEEDAVNGHTIYLRLLRALVGDEEYKKINLDIVKQKGVTKRGQV